MSIQNVLPALALEQAGEKVSGAPLNPEGLLANPTIQVEEQQKIQAKQQATEHDGPIGSHLLFGLGTLLFASPMVMPGIPMKWMVEGYLGFFCVAVTIAVLWFVFDAGRSRIQRSRQRSKQL